MSHLEQKQISDSLILLNKAVDGFVTFFKVNKNLNQMVYPDWTVKDVLGHITFWHESFARNLKDIAENKKPTPLEGNLSDVNKISVDSTREIPVNVLCQRLIKAQEIIAKHIFNTTVGQIPYKKGSRSYTRLEHLQVVNSHIEKHFEDITNKLQ